MAAHIVTYVGDRDVQFGWACTCGATAHFLTPDKDEARTRADRHETERCPDRPAPPEEPGTLDP